MGKDQSCREDPRRTELNAAAVPLRSYGRRKGHALSQRQERLVKDLLPRLAAPIVALSDPGALFDPPTDKIWLEIGFGAGEHLLAQALVHPDVGLIGAEPYLNGVASLLGRIETDTPANIRLHHGDAREIIDALPDASLDRIFVLHPDPWPKARHQKRRLMSGDMAAQFARVLRAGAELRFATDIGDCAEAAQEAMCGAGLFTVAPAREAWPATRYEQKAMREGRAPQRMVFLRREP